MIDGKRVLAIIPARGGSKGLPRKNIRPLLGKPLIAWTIEQAKESKYIDKIIVSSEDEEILKVSKSFGAYILKRPNELAEDYTPTSEVILHTLEVLENSKETYDIIVLLEPTSPLREVVDIDLPLELLLKTPKAEAIVSVAQLENKHPEFNVILDSENFIKHYNGLTNFKVLPRQKLDKVYFFDGTTYISYTETFKNYGSFYHDKTLGYIVPKWKSFEIDDIVDFVCVEAILINRKRGVLK